MVLWNQYENNNSSSFSSTAGLSSHVCTMFHPNIFLCFFLKYPTFFWRVPIDLQFCVFLGQIFFAFHYLIQGEFSIYFLMSKFCIHYYTWALHFIQMWFYIQMPQSSQSLYGFGTPHAKLMDLQMCDLIFVWPFFLTFVEIPI